jgi:hypothetical protein
MAASASRRRPPSTAIVRLSWVDPERQILEHLEPYVREATPDGAAAMLAMIAVERVAFEPDELSAAVRRALLVLAAGGDLRRELSLDETAVAGLAADLDDPTRRAELQTCLTELRDLTDELPATAEALDSLIADGDRAWRALATAVLADELTD